jgi:hypothetical protein
MNHFLASVVAAGIVVVKYECLGMKGAHCSITAEWQISHIRYGSPLDVGIQAGDYRDERKLSAPVTTEWHMGRSTQVTYSREDLIT